MGRLTDADSYMPAFLQGDLVTPMARTIMQGGEDQARAQLMRGQALQGMVGGVAQAAQQGVEAYQQQKTQSQIGQAVTSLMTKAQADPEHFDAGAEFKAMGLPSHLVGPASQMFNQAMQSQSLVEERAARAKKFAMDAQQAAAEAQQAQNDHLGGGMLQVSDMAQKDPHGALVFAQGLAAMYKAQGHPVPDNIQQELESLSAAPPEVVQQHLSQFGALAQSMMSPKALEEYQKANAPIKVGADETLLDPKTKQPFYTAPPKAISPAEQARLDLEKAGQAESARHNRAMEARAPAMGGMDRLYDETDPTAIAEAIMRGEREPETGNLGRGVVGAVDSYLSKHGFNKAKAVTDWKATQKHVASMNSAQQLRLNQSINALPDLLDSVDSLASQWKGGQFPILNRANLKLAMNGAYGSDAASLARQLDTQIADVVGDLGTVYMGGNSPTDHAIGLAKTALSSDWDEKTLHDMVKMAKGNVVIRRNSILNTGVMGTSADNPYAGGAQSPSPAPKADVNALRSKYNY